MSATLTLLVVIESIRDRLLLMYATTSLSWSSVVSSLSASALSLSVRPWISRRMSLWVSVPVLCAETLDSDVVSISSESALSRLPTTAESAALPYSLSVSSTSGMLIAFTAVLISSLIWSSVGIAASTASNFSLVTISSFSSNKPIYFIDYHYPPFTFVMGIINQ